MRGSRPHGWFHGRIVQSFQSKLAHIQRGSFGWCRRLGPHRLDGAAVVAGFGEFGFAGLGLVLFGREKALPCVFVKIVWYSCIGVSPWKNCIRRVCTEQGRPDWHYFHWIHSTLQRRFGLENDRRVWYFQEVSFRTVSPHGLLGVNGNPRVLLTAVWYGRVKVPTTLLLSAWGLVGQRWHDNLIFSFAVLWIWRKRRKPSLLLWKADVGQWNLRNFKRNKNGDPPNQKHS